MGESSIRDRNMDCVKGMLAFLVILGHCIQYGSGMKFFTSEKYFEDVLFKIIYSFHMPCFGLVSGALYGRYIKKKSFLYKMKKCLKSFITPILLLGMVSVLYEGWWQQIRMPLPELVVSYINTVLYKWWFVWVIIVSYFIFGIIDMLKFPATVNIILLVVIQIAMLVIPDYINSPLIGFIFPYFAVGYFMADRNTMISEKHKQGYIGILLLCGILWLIGICLFERKHYIYTSKLSLWNGLKTQVGIDIFRWEIGFLGCIVCLFVFFKITKYLPEKIGQILSFLGKHTLLIYILQDFLIPKFIYIKLFEGINIIYLNNVLQAIIVCILLLVFLVAGEKATYHMKHLASEIRSTLSKKL